jgi:mono/diheme cytochrome c family protein
VPSRCLRALAAVVVLSVPLAALPAMWASARPTSGDAARGKKIFVVRCVACHKADGSGGVKLTGNATPDWRDAKRMDDPKHGDDSLRACITNGKIQSGMVAWGKTGQLRPAQIEDLIVYIRAFSKK